MEAMGKDERVKDRVKDEDAKDARGKILAAIRRAAEELGRAPSRGELRRITGLSHYRVLAEFRTLREAVREAGLEPNPKGEKISTEDLLADWKRVAEKLVRRPSRAEYVREGRYSAGALTVRFGSWGRISTTEDTENHREKKSAHHGGAEARRKKELPKLPELPRLPKAEERNHKGHPYDSSLASSESLRAGYGTQRESGGLAQSARVVKPGESVLRNFHCVPRAPVPTPVVGMRRVTEAVAQMVVNTLMGGYWPLAFGTWPESSRELTRRSRICEGQAAPEISARGIRKEGDLGPSLAVNAPLVQDDGLMRRDLTRRGIKKDRPVMGEPFDRSPMTNAPVNELGVMVLFGMVAARLGLQVESVQGKFPDCLAKRQVAPGKWQHLRIEFEYESKNFKLHGHDPKGCDMIVCWRHNWKECPAEIEVVELSRLVGSN
ncbi:MAG: homing endonuclease associated repeat-containing protein [Candidatus Angelobacter sp.]